MCSHPNLFCVKTKNVLKGVQRKTEAVFFFSRQTILVNLVACDSMLLLEFV